MSGQKDDDFAFDYLTEWGQTMVDAIRNNLVSKDSWYDDSGLARGITILPVETNSEGYTLTIQVPDYAQFVDKGRRAGKKPPLDPIENWITARSIKLELKRTFISKNKKGISKPITRTFKNIMDARRSMAFGIQRNIGLHGTKPKGMGFYSEVMNDDAINELIQSLATKAGEVFLVEITDMSNGN